MGRPDLDISVRHESDRAVVTLAGEIDIGTAPRLTAAVENALEAQPLRVILDMSKVTFCDSQGLGTLVVLNRTATKSRSVLVLDNLTEFLDRLLHVTGLHQAFTISGETKT
ncbi:anti-anti-sigma factor [Stackebrandtia endophytica]|uniref:Anti-sigma factor antagonist n=1 Tax=Stackebrandtia endophytica TaxID=1496996 RepID=A0A543AYA6_9ACTN|nr:STAS domain-containing protein [Stackebrandtia endophytica]TQL77553.1 anti-anti-sigma factor [Stackebrandtia endophytica]